MANKRFQFHYASSPTGSISGQMVLTQTEDAINEIGEYMYSVELTANEALKTANQANSTADTALKNSNTALTTANSAITQVTTLKQTVETWDGRIQSAESNAQSAVTTANSALSIAQEALETAQTAETNSKEALDTANSALEIANETKETTEQQCTQAIGTANDALEAANSAVEIANQAVTDTDAVREEIDQKLDEAEQQVAAATAQAQNAAASAGQSEAYSDLAKDWATKTENTADEGEPADYTVADDEYSSKWYALNVAKQWAVKMDGQVTDNGTPEGTPVDYSAKYYAQQAKTSETNAANSATEAETSATNAATSETNAASSAAEAAESASNAAESATAAAGSATNAQESASSASSAAEAAQAAQEAAEQARDEAQEATGDAVLYTAQTLTDEQQAQARANIGALGADEGGGADLDNATGTLPIEHGGTGATTAAQALSNLGAIPANGNRGQIAGYELCERITNEQQQITITPNSPDGMVLDCSNGYTDVNIAFSFDGVENTTNKEYIKVLTLYLANTIYAINITKSDNVIVNWAGDEPPIIDASKPNKRLIIHYVGINPIDNYEYIYLKLDQFTNAV